MATNDPGPPASTVFVGNLSFDLTEQDIIDFFSQVGPVKSVRVATDKDTGKPRGFGFVEFFDIPSAESAVRNLGNTDLSGRPLRIVFSRDDNGPNDGPRGPRRDEDHRYDDRRRNARNKLVGGDLAYHSSHGMTTLLGHQPQSGAPADQVTVTLARKTRNELYEYLEQFQGLLKQNPQQAREILIQNPNLSRALLQIQIILGMVNNPLGDVAPKGVAPPGLVPPRHGGGDEHYGGGSGGQYEQQQQQPPYQAYQPPPTKGLGPMVPADPRLGAGAPAPVMPSDPRMGGGGAPPYIPPSAAPRPMVSVAALGSAPPAPTPAAQKAQNITPEQQALLQQVLTLTPAQIELLPPAQKAQVLALQQQMRGGS